MTRETYDELKLKVRQRRGMMSVIHQMMDIKEWWILGASDDLLPFIYQDLKDTVESNGENQAFSWIFLSWLEETFPKADPIPEEHAGMYFEICKDWFDWLNKNSILIII